MPLRLSRTIASLLLLIAALGQTAFSQPAEEEAAVASPPRPPLEFRKWSGTINVPDPVAVSVDNQGRVYATQTRRRKIQDLDIRSNPEWIPDDVGLKSVEDKRAFFKRVLAIGGDDQQQSQHVDDWNKDGVHDWRDLTVVSEAIYRLVDSDGDGTADEITVFAEDFKTEVTGIAAGVLAYDGDVYATVAPDVWKLRDQNADGVADSRESIAHGFGLHIAYGGHDMHGLTVGPDGKIYWSIGDKGINVTTPDGKNFAFPNQGGVMRCNPDGSDFEVFAHGLRNVQEVAFDQYGNMFGVDNDSDQTREKERFVYIVNDMDAGWRCNYQYRGEQYNPWVAERLWELPDGQHPAYIVPPIQHYIDGPAGFKFNPGTALSPEYQDFFFLTGAPNGNQHAFRVAAEGDSFKMVDEHQIGSGMAIVGLAFGPDGGLYGADWDGGYPLDEKGAVIRIDVASGGDSEQRRQVQQLLSEGVAGRSRTDLRALLGHADQRIRLAAQFQLVAMDAGDVLAGVATSDNASQLARLHAIWGLGQLGRDGDLLGRDILGLMLKESDAKLRGQAAKTYGELHHVNGTPLIDLLDDEDLHVRTLAGIALGRQPTPKAVEALWKQADTVAANQHYLRHSLVMGLAACATAEQLSGASKSENEMRRMCSLLALRRQQHVAAAEYLNDSSDWVAAEAARAIHDDESIVAALPALAAALIERKSQTEPFSRRAINANFRLGEPAAAERVLQFAASEERPEALRLDALQALAAWYTPPLLDRVEGRRRELPQNDRQVEADKLIGGLAQLTQGPNQPLRAAALAAARGLKIDLPSEALRSLATSDENAAQTRIEALNSLAERDPDILDVLLQTLEAPAVEVQIRGLEWLARLFPAKALEEIESLLQADAPLELQQTAIAALASLPDEAGRQLLEQLGGELASGELDSRLSLDVQQAVLQIPGLADTLKLATEKYAYARDGGNAQRGAAIFENHVQAQCSRCHRVGKEGSEIGPELTTVARTRDADYLLRAIAQPSADIDAKYRMHMLLLDSGQIVKGVIQSQDDDQTVVADSNGKLVDVETDAIEESSEQKTSLMPDMSELLSPAEVRDLVAYLRSLK